MLACRSSRGNVSLRDIRVRTGLAKGPVSVTYLCQTKVTYHTGARLVVEQKIRRLDISVDDAASVNVLEPLEEVKHVHLDVRRVHVAVEVLDDVSATKTSTRRPSQRPTRKSSDR
jgi:hypothetical protein